MTGEKGYVQFRCEWERAPPPAGAAVAALIAWRDRLRARGLVGVLPDGIGYGNLSCRAPGGASFLVTGTATGGIEALAPEHVTEVTACDIDGNALRCRGPVRASSESLSHAAVYRGDPDARAVVHVHHAGLWARLLDAVPTTDRGAEAGTPAMAREIERVLRDGRARESGLLAMGGHPDGIMAFGRSLDEAGTRVLEAYARFVEEAR